MRKHRHGNYKVHRGCAMRFSKLEEHVPGNIKLWTFTLQGVVGLVQGRVEVGTCETPFGAHYRSMSARVDPLSNVSST